MKVHLVFHVSLLQHYAVNQWPGRTQDPPPPIGDITEDSEDNKEWEVESIMKL